MIATLELIAWFVIAFGLIPLAVIVPERRRERGTK